MSNLIKHAEYELSLVGEQNDTLQKAMNSGILRIVKLFAEENHSGLSADYVINIINKLLKFEPITPLTGENSEWVEVSEGLHQNKRCSRIFKDINRFEGKPYDIEAVIFVDKNGGGFTSADSFKVIEFPYTPRTELVKINR